MGDRSSYEHFEKQIRDLAGRHQISEHSICQLVNRLLSTSGGQVQFNIPEFGGMGQCMPGMIMVSDLFNHGLKTRVDVVCSDIARRVRAGTIRLPVPEGVSGFTASPAKWWPDDPGVPAAAGAQNNMRYAWFHGTRRFAVDLRGESGSTIPAITGSAASSSNSPMRERGSHLPANSASWICHACLW